MKYIYFLFLGLLPAILPAQADNFMGGGIYYSYNTGSASYDIQLTIYGDCSKDPFPAAQKIYISAPGCASDSTTLSLYESSDITPYLPGQNSPCNTGTDPVPVGAIKYIYKGSWTPSTTCTSYELSWSTCCRNNDITTSQLLPDIYLYATMPAPSLENNSPFNINPVLGLPYVCVDQQKPYPINLGLSDPDGDSLHIEAVECLDQQSSQLTYLAPYSPLQPVSVNANGIADVLQKGIQCFQVTEYRNGQLIGSYLYERLITVTDCDFNVLSVDNIAGQKNVSIYPNPFRSKIYIYGAEDNTEIKIYDITGKLLLTRKNISGNDEISADHLLQGIYLIEVATDHQREIIKVVKTE